jgi:hypothetical protein
MKKYTWFKNEEETLSYTVIHTEDGKETIICITDSAEKADFIAEACNRINLDIL